MEEVDIDCLSCAYAIKDFGNVINVACGHGFIHYNCLYFNNECPVCEGKLTADSEQKHILFRPKEQLGEENLKIQLVAINQALQELKNLMMIQKEEQCNMLRTVDELRDELKAKDERIVELQKEIYSLKLEKVEQIKKELEEKLSNLT